MAKNKRLRELIKQRNKDKANTTGNVRKFSTTLPSSRKNIEMPKSTVQSVQQLAENLYNQSVTNTPTQVVKTNVSPSVANNLSSVSANTNKSTGFRSTTSATPTVKANKTVTKNEPKVKETTAKVLYEAEQAEKQKQQEKELKKATSTADRIAIKATQIMENTFQKPQQLYDGFQLKDAVTIPVQTATSVASHVIGGVEQVSNSIAQTWGYGLAMANRAIGNEKMAERWEKATKQAQADRENTRNLLFDLSDRGSVLGTTANQVAEGYGQSLALGVTGSQSKALGNALTFGQGFGNSLHDSYAQEDVEDWQALLRATGHGFSTYIAENAFENLGYGGSKIDDALQNALTKKFNSGFSKALARTGISATGEALEEIMEPFMNSKIVDNLINVITEKVGHGAKFDTDLNAEELAESALIGFLSGGFSQGSATISNNITDSNIAISQKEKELGRKLTSQEKAEIKEETLLNSEKAKENLIDRKNQIEKSGLTKFQKEKITEQVEKYNLSEQDVQYLIDNTKNGKYDQKQATTMENKAISNQSQQVIQTEGKIDENQISQETKQNTKMLKTVPGSEFKYVKSDDIRKDNFRKQASQYWNNSKIVQNYVGLIERIIDDKGVEVILDPNLKSSDGKIANGTYKNGVIRLNPYSEEFADALIVHELTHGIGTKAMLNMVKRFRKNGEFNETVESLLENYDESEINEEALAFASQQVLGNIDTIMEIANTDMPLFEKIYKEIKYLWHQFRGYKNKNEFIEDLYYKWTQAYHSNRKLNQTEKYLFGGKNALLANKINLEKAKELEDTTDANEIWKQTGWYKATDGEWRFEIYDKDFDTMAENIKKNTTKTLQEILVAKELYDNYPEIKNVDVIFKDLPKNDKGGFSVEKEEIYISNKLVTENMADLTLQEFLGIQKQQDVYNTLLHEIQHYIQKKEGFSKGASVEYWSERLEKEASEKLIEFEKDIYNKYGNNSQTSKKLSDLSQLWFIMRESDNLNTNLRKAKNKQEADEINKKLEYLDKKFEEFQYKAEQNFGKEKTDEYISIVEQKLPSMAEFKYSFTGGELESREVQKRKQYDKNDRENNLPEYVKNERIRKQTVHVENNNNKGYNKSIGDDANGIRMGNSDNGNGSIITQNRQRKESSRRDNTNNAKNMELSENIRTREKSNNFNVDSKRNNIRGRQENVGIYNKRNNQGLEESSSFNLQKLEDRLSGDDLLDAQDFIEEVKSVGAEVDENGYVTVYHQTTNENAKKIKESGKMSAKEDGIFFSTSKNAQQSEGRGTEKIKFKVPAELLQLDDIFEDNADVRIPLKNRNQILDVSQYIVKENNIKEKQVDNTNPTKNPDIRYSITQESRRNIESKIDRYSRIVDQMQKEGKNSDEWSIYANEILRLEDKLENGDYSLSDETSKEKFEKMFGSVNEVKFSDMLKQKEQPKKISEIFPKNVLLENTTNSKRYTGKKQTNNEIAKILDTPKERQKPEDRKWAILKANILDKGIVFEDLSKKAKNRELEAKWDYTLSSGARGQYAIGNARYEYVDGKKTKVAKGLTEIIDEVGDKVSDFQNYMYHQLNVDRMSLEKNAKAEMERMKANELFNYNDVVIRNLARKRITDKLTPERKQLILDAKQYVALSEVQNKPVFGKGVTEFHSKNKVAEFEKNNPEFKKWAKDVYDYLKADKMELVKNGVISEELSSKFEQLYPHYVPIQRVDKNGNAISVPLDTRRTGINTPIKEAKGGNSDIGPLFQTMANRTMQTYRASARNSLGLELRKTLQQLNNYNGTDTKADLDNIIESMENENENNTLLQASSNGRLPTFTVFENGNKVTFDISEDVYDALKPKDSSSLTSKTSKILNTIGNVRRGLLTEYNPLFSVTNTIKDAQDVLANSQHALKTYLKFPEAYQQILQKGYWYEEYMQNGGEQNSYFKEGDFVKEEKSKIKSLVTLPLEKISQINNVMEMAPRLAEYIASRESGRSIQTSMLDASRVTTNFKAGGDVTKFLNRNGATFLNAGVQGTMQVVRNFREANMQGAKGYAILASKMAVMGLPVLILNNLIWDDDEEYDELQDYVKDSYYIVGKTKDGNFIRIPKGRFVASVQKIVSNVNDYLNNKKELNIDNVSKDLWESLGFAFENMAPNNPIENNVASPIFQVANNTSWYGEDIVPERLQSVPKAEQYDETTDAFSIWLGDKLNVSPMKINYLLDQYGGGVADILLPMGTKQAENNVIEDKFTTNPTMKSKYPGEFFEKSDEIEVQSNSMNATDEDIVKNKYMADISGEMSKLYKEKRKIQNSDATDESKKEQLEKVQEQINEFAKTGIEEVDKTKVNQYIAEVGDKAYYKDDEGKWKEIDKEKDLAEGLSLKTYADYKNKVAIATDKKRVEKNNKNASLSDSEKSQILLDSNYSEKEKRLMYPKYIGNEDKTYEYLSKITGDKVSIDQYLDYKTQSDELKADDDPKSNVKGKTVSGSKKKKVVNYLNNSDFTAVERLYIYGTQYSFDSKQKIQFTNYIDTAKKQGKITSSEAKEIYKKLNSVQELEDGRIRWK